MKIESQPSGLKRQYYDVDDGDDMPGLMDGSDDEDRRPHHQRQRPTLLKRLGAFDANKCDGPRYKQLNELLAKCVHHNALPFTFIESDEFQDFVKALCPAYYAKGIPGRFWMASTGLDYVYDEVHEDVESHLGQADALFVGIDGWENQRKENLKNITATGSK